MLEEDKAESKLIALEEMYDAGYHAYFFTAVEMKNKQTIVCCLQTIRTNVELEHAGHETGKSLTGWNEKQKNIYNDAAFDMHDR